MTLLEELQTILLPGHRLTIKPLGKTSYYRDCNKKSNDSKYLYYIKLDCPNSKAGKGFLEHENFTLADIAPSKHSGVYNKQINEILNKFSNGQIYCSGYSECGTEIEYTIRWIAKELVKV